MNRLVLLAGLGMKEIIFILLILLLLFKGKKIPELMKGLGKGVKSFKEGVSGIENDLKVDVNATKKETPEEEKSK